jgi:hypothetical protein
MNPLLRTGLSIGNNQNEKTFSNPKETGEEGFDSLSEGGVLLLPSEG